MYSLFKFYLGFMLLMTGLFSCENRGAASRSPAIDRAPIEDYQSVTPSTNKKMRKIYYRSAKLC